MQKPTQWIAALCVLAASVSSAQQSPRAGLWLISTTTRIQQQGESPADFSASPQGQASPEPAALPVCLSQEIVDKFGVILPPSLRDCELSNVVQAADNFHADMTCKGSYNGVGSVESSWADGDHVKGKIRFVSRSGESGKGRQMTWAQESTAVFKSSDCGDVKPRKIPVKQAPAKPAE